MAKNNTKPEEEDAVVTDEEQQKKKPHEKVEEVYQLSIDEFFEISRSLEDKHAIFYKLWEIGRPVFTRSPKVPTAEVRMDRDGNGISFLFNYDWWQKITPYTRKFIICHEMLHLILNHGIRIRDAKTGANTIVNKALDVVVNHLLLKRFKFDRTFLQGPPHPMTKDNTGPEQYCWVDTAFDPKNDPSLKGKFPPDNMSFEYYYNLLPKNSIDPHWKPKQGDVIYNKSTKQFGKVIVTKKGSVEVKEMTKEEAAKEVMGNVPQLPGISKKKKVVKI